MLAVPLPAVPDVLRRVDAIAPTCRLTDAVSVKVAVADAVDRYAPRARYVGGHPMAGTAESGWAAGDAELFTGAAWVVAADDGLDLDVWRDVARPGPAGRRPGRRGRARPLSPDLAPARTCWRRALAVGAGDRTPPSWWDPRSHSPRRRSPTARGRRHRPELVLAMYEGSRDALLAAVDDALGRWAAGLARVDGGLAATVKAGYAGRMRWSATREPLEHRVSLAGADTLAELREVGRRGEVVTGWA